MLTNLFRLDGSPQVVGPNDPMPSMSPGETVSNVIFEIDPWPSPLRTIRGVTFRGVSISKVTVNRVTFVECKFEDCLFLGTHFSEVEFHNCHFINSNLWKARFERVYLDPRFIKLESRFHTEAANVGISVFQALLSNYQEDRQDEFYMLADIQFRRWKRYQIWHNLRHKRLSNAKAYAKWVSSIFYDSVAGFGYRPGRYFIATIVFFLLISVMNHFIVSNSIVLNGVALDSPSFLDTAFYSFSILTVLGFSSIVLTSEFGKLLAIVEALAAIGWLGIFTSVLVKRFLR